ncbi:4234_t:CDS:2 [Ambispora gerdemannii]|uniref:4234_t:CDS:1 n=1 Tax=Ambispora gerdemannii TaxID=144530 RepID=A0A9N8Z8L9_9GLOM|nr:4234_t:CDS:2 [Ambispora gerdemannii]
MDNDQSTATTSTMTDPLHNNSLTKDNSSLPSSSSSKKSSKSLSESPDKMTSIKNSDEKSSKRSKSLEITSSSLSKTLDDNVPNDSSSRKSSLTDGSINSSVTIKSSSSSTTSNGAAVPTKNQKPNEKMVGKTIISSSLSLNGRRPSPLSLVEENDHYNSRTVPVRDTTPSNPSFLASSSTTNTTTTTNPHNATATQSSGLIGAVPPRRATSNPGQPRKNMPGTPNSPWIGGFSIQSPALYSMNSPMFSPATIYRSDSPSLAKSMDTPTTATLPTSYSIDSNQMSFDEVLGQPNKTGLPEPPPTDVHMRPFWLMRILERTMTTGGYLTKKLFVPNNMWVQANVKLASVEAKLSSCDVIYNCLLRLEKTTIDDLDSLVKELDSIEPLFDGIQNSLARKLNYVESTNGKSRQSTSLMSWGSKLSQRLDRMGMGNVANRSEEASSYVDILLKVFLTARIVEVYISHFSSLKAPYHHHHTHIVSRLYKISDFFGNVLCRFVVRDLGVLADKYVKRGGNWVTD